MQTGQGKVKLREGQELYIVPLGDIHYNCDDCDKERLKRVVAWAQGKKDRGHIVRLIGMGDYNDTLSSSERAALAAAKGGMGLHDQTLKAFDDYSWNITEDLYKVLSPLTGDFLGLLEGHHYMKFHSSSYSQWKARSNTELLASRLGCPYFGTSTLYELDMGHDLTLELYAHHGAGSAATKGGRINKRHKLGQYFPHAQLIFLGHDHEKIAGVDNGIILDREAPNGIRSFKRYYLGTGGFLKGYVPRTEGTYIEQGLMPPGDLGITVVVCQVEKRAGKWRLDYHVSI